MSAKPTTRDKRSAEAVARKFCARYGIIPDDKVADLIRADRRRVLRVIQRTMRLRRAEQKRLEPMSRGYLIVSGILAALSDLKTEIESWEGKP